MKSHESQSFFVKAAWTISSFGGSFALKLGSNIILSRILAPEIFGIMVIVNSIKNGIELLTDVGVEQNIVNSKNGAETLFFNTAWTIQIIRGAILSVIFLAASPSISHFYSIDVKIFRVISFAPFINSLASTSIFLLVKDLRVKQRNIFELSSEFVSFLITVSLAVVTPTIWALVLGAIFSLALRSSFSYLIAHPPHRLILRAKHVNEIMRFGKWIALSSVVVFAAGNIDKIFLGKFVELPILGIYGIARTIAELPGALAGRLSYQIIFPLLSSKSSHSDVRGSLYALKTLRLKFLTGTALLIGLLAALANQAIDLIYDDRYQGAGDMLSLLLFASWFSVLSSLNEAQILSHGRPGYLSATNLIRLFVIILGLPIGYHFFGIEGSIIALIAAEVVRYMSISYVQKKIGVGFFIQDLVASIIFFSTVFVGFYTKYLIGNYSISN